MITYPPDQEGIALKVPLLEVGDTAFGMLVDMTDLPETAAMLRRDIDGLQLVVPLPPNSPYERWFHGGRHPETLWLVCGDNKLAVVGCHAAHTSGVAFGVREGRMYVSMIVHGAKAGEDYGTIHGMQSAIPGIGLFLGQRSMEIAESRSEDGRLESLTLNCSRTDPVVSSPRLNFVIERGFAFADSVPGDNAIIEDQFQARTRVKRARSWEEHLTPHMALRDLVSLAAWEPFDLTALHVMRTSDPATSISGREFGIEWRPAQQFALAPRDSRRRQRPTFLFEFRDLAKSCLQRWFQLRDTHGRAIQIMITGLRQSGVPIEAQLLQIGAAFDVLGYQLILDRTSSTQAKSSSFEERASEVAGGLPSGTCDANRWSDVLKRTYRGAKHGDRALPHPEEAFNAVSASQLIFRLWVGRKLGLSDRRTMSKSGRLRRLGY